MGGSNSTGKPENGRFFHPFKKRNRKKKTMEGLLREPEKTDEEKANRTMEGLLREPEKTDEKKAISLHRQFLYKDCIREIKQSRVLKHNSGKETVEGLAGKPEKTELRNRFRDCIRELEQAFSWKDFDYILSERTKEDNNVNEEAENIKDETKKLSQKPESDPQVVEAAEFFTTMTEEILEQKARLTKSILKETGKRSNPQSSVDGEKLRRNDSSDNSPETIESKHKLRTERAAKENMEDCGHYRIYHDILKGEYHTSQSLKDEKGMSGDQLIQATTTRHPEFANSNASHKDVCCDVKKYIQQISRLVQERICSLPEEVKKKLESVMMSFQRLITGMWKLLLYDLLLYEMTRFCVTDQKEESNISKKRGRFKYGFQMASMMALWLAHDVESNPGPSFYIRSCLERITRDLSEVLRYHLPVSGSLWSESVAAAAYAAGYSTEYQWNNPSGNSKDKLMTLIERATELGRVLTTLDCLPPEFAPFVNDLGNYVIQEQLVVHYKMKNFRSAVDMVLGISNLGDEHKQAIIHEIQRLKQISEVPHSSKRPMDAGRMCTTTDFVQLADSTTSRPNVSLQSKSQNSAVPEQEAAVTLGQQMDPGSDGKNDTNIVVNLNETLSAVSKVQEVTVQEDIATKSMSARNTDRRSTSDENQTFSVGTKESEPLGSTGEAISNPNEIFDSNIISQLHDIEFDDFLVWLDGTETQVQNVMDDDAKSTYMPRTATNYPVMTQLQVTVANISNSGSIPTGQGHEKIMNINPDVTESDKESDSTLQGNTGQGGTTDYLDRDRDSLTQDREEAGEHRIGNDDSVEKTGEGQHMDKTKSKTELLQQTITLQATGSNSGLESARNEPTSVDRGSIKETMDDTCENEAETLSSGEQQFADAEMETEPIQQTLASMTAVTNSYPDTDIDEMYREETVDENTSWTRENEIEDLNLGTEQFASTEPADTQKKRMESTVGELFAKLKASLLKEVDARLEAFKAALESNTRNEHVMNDNGQPQGCALSDVERTELRVGSSNSSRKRNLTDPADDPTSKKLRQ